MATQISGVICVEEFNENKDKGPTESKSHNHTRGIRLARMLHREVNCTVFTIRSDGEHCLKKCFQCFLSMLHSPRYIVCTGMLYIDRQKYLQTVQRR